MNQKVAVFRKEHWKIKEAIDNLNEHLLKYIDKVYKIK